MKISTGKKVIPKKVLIYGIEGIGKTTLASKFPQPLFIDVENGSSNYNVQRFDEIPSSWSMLLNQVKYVYDNPSICKTLVIDSFDWAENLCKNHINKTKGWSSIGDPDWGKGYTELESVFGKFLNMLDEIINKGINVVGIAHSEIKTIQKPGEVGNYDKYQVKLEKKTSALIKEWADAIIFLNYETFITNKKSGKGVITGGKRKMHLNSRPEYEAKNRWNLEEESYDLDYSIIAPFIFHKEEIKVEEPKEKTKEEVTKKDIEENDLIETKEEVPFRQNDELEKVKPELKQLMQTENVTLDELMNAVALRGYYPVGTEYENLDPDFVDAVLISGWNNGLLSFIKELRNNEKIKF